jgi:hypothetical protein
MSLSCFCQAHCFSIILTPKFGILVECIKYVFYHNVLLTFPFSFLFAYQLLWVLKFVLDCSATTVDVEEHMYRLATNMGTPVVTSSQVIVWTIPAMA